MSSPRTLIPLAAALCAALTLPARAEDQEPLFNANVLGMGGAARAVPLEVSNLELNPGALVVGDRYAVELSAGTFGDRSEGFGRVAITDSLTSPRLSAGVAYDVGWRPGALTQGWEVVGASEEESPFVGEGRRDLTFALAGAAVEGRLGLGASFKSLRTQLEGEDPHRELSADLGVYGRPIEALSLGLVANNLFAVDDEDQPTSVAVAASAFVHPQILVASDVVMNLRTGDGPRPGVHVGLAATAASFLPVRLGFYTTADGESRASYFTAGLGLVSTQASLSYALRVRVDGLGDDGAPSAFTHLLTLELTMG